MLYYKQEFDLLEFEFWDGATEVIKEVEEQDRMLELGWLLEGHLFRDGYLIPDDIEINDFVWFEVPDLMELYEGEEEDY